MSDITDRFVTSEGDRAKNLQAILGSQGKSETRQPYSEMPEFMNINPSNLLLMTGLYLAPEATIFGSSAGEILKSLVKFVLPNNPKLQEGADLLGNLVGGLYGDPTSREMMLEKFGGIIPHDIMQEKAAIMKKIADLNDELNNQGGMAKATDDVIEAYKAKYNKLIAEYVNLPETSVAKAAKSLQAQGTQAKLNQLTKESASRAYKIAQSKLKVTSNKAVDMKLNAMSQVLKTTGSMYTAEIHGMLLNPRITIQKLLTDVVNLPVQTMFKGLGTSVDHNLPAGAKATLSALHGFRESYKDAFRLAFETFKTGEPEFLKSLGIEQPEKYSYALEAWDNSAHATSFRYLRNAYAFGSKTILAADQFAKALAYSGELHMNAFYEGLRQADESGLLGAAKLHYAEAYAEKLYQDSPEWLHQKALQGMFKDTFTDTGKFTKAVENLRNATPLGIGKMFVPFFRTPANLIKQGMQITPFGPLFSSGDIQLGGLDQSSAIAKWMVGTALFYELSEQTNKGNITGDGPHGKGRELWPGYKHPRSIRVGGQWVSYAHLGPFADIISLAADSTEMYNLSKEPEDTQKLLDAVGDVFTEKVEEGPFLQNIYNMFHALDSWKNGGAGKAAKEFLTRTATGFIPAAVRVGAQISDPRIKKAETVRDMVAENIPYFSKYVPSNLDIYGNERYPAGAYDSNGGVSKWHYALNQVNPLPTYPKGKLDPVDKEMFSLGYNPEPIPDYWYKSGSNTVPIDPMQKYEWQKYTGHEFKIDGKGLHDMFSWTINQPWYKDMTSSMKKTQLQQVYHMYREAGKEHIDELSGHALQKQEIDQQMQQEGIQTQSLEGVTTK